MPADDASNTITILKFKKVAMVEKAKCPRCEDGWLERDAVNNSFALSDRFANEINTTGKRAYMHVCSNCKARITVDGIYPNEYEVLVPEEF